MMPSRGPSERQAAAKAAKAAREAAEAAAAEAAAAAAEDKEEDAEDDDAPLLLATAQRRPKRLSPLALDWLQEVRNPVRGASLG